MTKLTKLHKDSRDMALKFAYDLSVQEAENRTPDEIVRDAMAGALAVVCTLDEMFGEEIAMELLRNAQQDGRKFREAEEE